MLTPLDRYAHSAMSGAFPSAEVAPLVAKNRHDGRSHRRHFGNVPR